MSCCGRTDGTKRQVTDVIMFVAIDSVTKEYVGVAHATFIEARIDAKAAGPGHSVKTLFDQEALTAAGG